MPGKKFEDSLTYYSQVLSRQIRRFGKALSDDNTFESEFGWVSNYKSCGNESLELGIISVCLVRVFTAIKWYIATMEPPLLYTPSQLEDRNRILREIKYNLASLQNRLEKYADEISFLLTPEEERKSMLAEEKIREILSVVFRKPHHRKEDQDGWNLLIKEQLNSIRRSSWQAGHNEGELTLVNDLKAILDIAQQITTNIERKKSGSLINRNFILSNKVSKCPCEEEDCISRDRSYGRISNVSPVAIKERGTMSNPQGSPRRISPRLSGSDEVFGGTDLSSAWDCVRQTVLRKKNVPKLKLDLSDSDGEKTGSSKKSRRKSDSRKPVVSDCSSEYESHSDVSVLSRSARHSGISSGSASAASSYHEPIQFQTTASKDNSFSAESAKSFRPIGYDGRYSSQSTRRAENEYSGSNREFNQAAISAESTPLSAHSSYSGRHGEHTNCYRNFAISNYLQSGREDKSDEHLYRSSSPGSRRKMDISPSSEFYITTPRDGSPPDMETTVIQTGERSCTEVNSQSSVTSSRMSYSPVTGCSVEVHTSTSQRRRQQIETDVCQTIILRRPLPFRILRRPRYDPYAIFVWFCSVLTFFLIMWHCFPTSFRGSRSMFQRVTNLELVYICSIIDCIKRHIEFRHFGAAPI